MLICPLNTWEAFLLTLLFKKKNLFLKYDFLIWSFFSSWNHSLRSILIIYYLKDTVSNNSYQNIDFPFLKN